MTIAYDQIINMSGLMTEQDYKYEGKQHNQCLLDKTKIKSKTYELKTKYAFQYSRIGNIEKTEGERKTMIIV